LKRWAFQRRTEAQLLGRKGFWSLVAGARPRPDFNRLTAILAHTSVKSVHARILEVGCGSGKLLRELSSAGFDSLLGVDPFLERDFTFGPGLRIEVKRLEEVRDSHFDLIMFNHSLEHMSDQLRTLRTASDLLRNGGVCVVRIPVAGSDPWLSYGADWVELDPPRHLCLHTVKSMRVAAARADLDVTHVQYEGTSFGYWASELYRRDMSLHDGPSRRDPGSYFTTGELEAFERRSEQANAAGQGGRAAFFLTKHR
jgi:SAM-dependent methyltransferase